MESTKKLITLPNELKIRLDEIAKDQHTNASKLIVRVLREYVDNYQKKKDIVFSVKKDGLTFDIMPTDKNKDLPVHMLNYQELLLKLLIDKYNAEKKAE